MIEDDIKELQQQVTALQAALSLVLGPEHRKIINSKDLRSTLKDLMKHDENDMIVHQMQIDARNVTTFGPVTDVKTTY